MIDPAQTTVVVNPAAAGGRVGRELPAYEALVRRHLGPVTIVHTEQVGHAIELAEAAVRGGADTVLSLGGDGTHSEVVNGIMRADRRPGSVALGLLPAGTGGDLRRLLAHGADVGSSAAAMGNAVRQPIDVMHIEYRTDEGQLESRFCVNMISIGMGGAVDRRVNQSSKRLGGKLTFAIATARVLAVWRAPRVQVWTDGEDRGTFEVANVVVANGRYAGGGMLFAPEARLGDGLLDVIIIPQVPLLRSVTMTPALYDGTLAQQPGVVTCRATRVRVEPLTAESVFLDLDGESPGRAPVEIEVRPGAIALLGAADGVV